MKLHSEDQRPRWSQGKKGEDDKRDGLAKRIVPNPRSRHPLMLWIIVSFIIFMAFQLYFQSKETRVEISYTRFIEEIEAGNLASADIADRHVEGELATTATIIMNGAPVEFIQFDAWLLVDDPDLFSVIREHSPDAVLNGLPPATNWGGVVFSILPLAVIVVFWIFIMRTMRGGAGPGKAFSFGKSGAQAPDRGPPEGHVRRRRGPSRGEAGAVRRSSSSCASRTSSSGSAARSRRARSSWDLPARARRFSPAR